jgi:flagellar biosynthesis protein
LMQLPLNEEIPESLYVAVAVVLSWAYWLTGRRPDSM